MRNDNQVPKRGISHRQTNTTMISTATNQKLGNLEQNNSSWISEQYDNSENIHEQQQESQNERENNHTCSSVKNQINSYNINTKNHHEKKSMGQQIQLQTDHDQIQRRRSSWSPSSSSVLSFQTRDSSSALKFYDSTKRSSHNRSISTNRTKKSIWKEYASSSTDRPPLPLSRKASSSQYNSKSKPPRQPGPSNSATSHLQNPDVVVFVVGGEGESSKLDFPRSGSWRRRNSFGRSLSTSSDSGLSIFQPSYNAISTIDGQRRTRQFPEQRQQRKWSLSSSGSTRNMSIPVDEKSPKHGSPRNTIRDDKSIPSSSPLIICEPNKRTLHRRPSNGSCGSSRTVGSSSHYNRVIKASPAVTNATYPILSPAQNSMETRDDDINSSRGRTSSRAASIPTENGHVTTQIYRQDRCTQEEGRDDANSSDSNLKSKRGWFYNSSVNARKKKKEPKRVEKPEASARNNKSNERDRVGTEEKSTPQSEQDHDCPHNNGNAFIGTVRPEVGPGTHFPLNNDDDVTTEQDTDKNDTPETTEEMKLRNKSRKAKQCNSSSISQTEKGDSRTNTSSNSSTLFMDGYFHELRSVDTSNMMAMMMSCGDNYDGHCNTMGNTCENIGINKRNKTKQEDNVDETTITNTVATISSDEAIQVASELEKGVSEVLRKTSRSVVMELANVFHYLVVGEPAPQPQVHSKENSENKIDQNDREENDKTDQNDREEIKGTHPTTSRNNNNGKGNGKLSSKYHSEQRFVPAKIDEDTQPMMAPNEMIWEAKGYMDNELFGLGSFVSE